MLLAKDSVKSDARVVSEAKSLIKDGYNVTVVAWDRKGFSKRREEYEGIKIERVRLKMTFSNLPNLMFHLILFNIVTFFRLLSKNFDIVHCHDFDTLIAGLFAGKFKGKKVVYDAHEYYPSMVLEQIPYISLSWIDRALVRIADCVIIPSEDRRKFYTDSKNIILVPNTPKLVDVRRKIVGGNFMVFYGGMLSEENGILIAIKAMAGLKDTKLILAGDGPLRCIIKNISKNNNNIEYLGFISQKEVLENLAQSDATFVFYEPTNLNRRYAASNKLFEAMMVGTPVIINKETVSSKLVESHDCGIIVPYGDVQKLRSEIIRLKRDPLLKKRLGQNGKNIFREKYAWDLLEIDFVNKYKLLLKK